MSRFGVQALPTTPLIIPQWNTNDPSRWNLVSVSIRNTDTVQHTVTFNYIGGEVRPEVLPAGANFLRRNCALSEISVDSGSLVLAFIASEPEYEDPQYLTTITGTVNENITQVNSVAIVGSNLPTDVGQTNHSDLTAINTKLASIITLLGAGLPGALSTGGGVKVHDVGS